MTLEIRAQRQPWRDGVELMAIDISGGKKSVAQPLVFSVVDEGCLISEPMTRLTNTAAQLLMDELWRCGLRPTEGSGSAGSLAATERHLKDMQTIAMGLLKGHGV